MLIALGVMAASQRPAAQAAGSPAAQEPGAPAAGSQRASLADASRTPTPSALLQTYCVTCHNQRLKTAGLTLDTMDLARIGAGAGPAEMAAWEKVVRKLRGGAMPPLGARRPDKSGYDLLAGALERTLDSAAEAHPNPGRSVPHRLNRAEYTNAIRDLLALDVDGRALLPADESAYGFDNIAGVLMLSQGLLERYLLAAQKISAMATGAERRTTVRTYRVSLALVQSDRVSEDLPIGSRGGAAIRHHFPADGEYRVRVRLRRTFNNGVITGLQRREQLDFRLDGVRVASFAVGGECVGSSEPRCVRPPTFGARTTIPSEYERTADTPLEQVIHVAAGTRLLGVQFLKGIDPAPEGAAPLRHPAALASATDEDVEMMVDSVQVEGPFTPTPSAADTPSQRAVFVCQPASGADELPCATKILTNLARRAYRRSPTPQDIETLLKLYRSGRQEADFHTGIQLGLEGVLVSPNFLFRVETDPANGPAAASTRRLTGVELASRLSFFLWSSIPDEELLQAASRGALDTPATLEQQVRRMLRDERSSALVENFAGQWLHLRNMRVAAPDPRVFPDFDENLRDAFERETELFLASQIREDRSVIDVLRADYTFVNERLARFYGIPNVYGSHFRRVNVTDPNRRGLLGQGSVLTVTSYSTRTSPVLRGKWLLENVLGAPPPPPPPNVPDLDLAGGTSAQAPRSVRQRLETHRRSPACASCHAVMDPLGFALENFDGIGKWRTRDEGQAIDSSGVLLDGTKFTGAAEFRQVLTAQGDAFARTVTEKLLTYALGRELEYYDVPAVRTIVRDASRHEYAWSSLILGVVRSLPFQSRGAPGAPEREATTARR